jgi:hypothetical protein
MMQPVRNNMEFTSTVFRLLNLIEVQNELFNGNESIEQLAALDNLIAKQAARTKANIMLHILDGLDFFSGKE